MKQNVETGSNLQGNSPSLATVLSNLQWGGPAYPAYMCRGDVTTDGGGGGGAAAPAAGTGSGGSSAGAPTASPAGGQGGSGAAPAQGGTGASPASGGAAAPAPGASGGSGGPNDANLATLRTNYEQYRQLGEFSQVQSQVQTFQGLMNRYVDMADKLGYEPDSAREVFMRDPTALMSQINREWAAAQRAQGQGGQGQGQGQPNIEQLIDKKIAPITQHIAAQRADAAEQLITNEFNTLLGAHDTFKGDATNPLPPEIREVIYDMVTESMKYDEPALLRVYNEGKTSDVKKYFDGVAERFIKVVNAYNAWTAKRGGGQVTGQGQGGQVDPRKGLTLDDVIAGNDKAMAALPSMRG